MTEIIASWDLILVKKAGESERQIHYTFLLNVSSKVALIATKTTTSPHYNISERIESSETSFYNGHPGQRYQRTKLTLYNIHCHKIVLQRKTLNDLMYHLYSIKCLPGVNTSPNLNNLAFIRELWKKSTWYDSVTHKKQKKHCIFKTVVLHNICTWSLKRFTLILLSVI